MSDFIIDYKSLAYHPDWENILCELIDLELGLVRYPRRRFIVRYILEGYNYTEIGSCLGLSKRQIQREVDIIRHVPTEVRDEESSPNPIKTKNGRG